MINVINFRVDSNNKILKNYLDSKKKGSCSVLFTLIPEGFSNLNQPKV